MTDTTENQQRVRAAGWPGLIGAVAVVAAIAMAVSALIPSERSIDVGDRPDDPTTESPVLGDDDTPVSLPGEPGSWYLVGTSPDARALTVATDGGTCSDFHGWVSEEGPDRVVVEGHWEDWDVDACNLAGVSHQLTLELAEPLGDRELVGCGSADCLTPPGETAFTQTASTRQVTVADDALIITGGETTWGLDPTDGEVRWERPTGGDQGRHWHRAVDGAVLRYDHLDHIELLDAVTGETRWEEYGVTLAGVDGDEVVVCGPEGVVDLPERDVDHGPFTRAALSLADGSWLWAEQDTSCTTDSIGQEQPEVPEVDLDPDVVGYGEPVLTAHGDTVFAVTATGVVALDPSTGRARWSTTLVPADAVLAGGIHPAAPHEDG